LAPAQQPVQQQPQLDQQYADQQPEQQQQQQLEQPRQLLTCKRCRQRFDSSSNCGASCRCHPAMYSGGEVAKVGLAA
jgi:hypothetical protein